MILREKQAEFLKMIAKLVTYSNEQPLCLLEWTRTVAQQQVNISRGVSKTMNSKHLVGLAMDFCFLGDLQDDKKINWDIEKYRKIGEYWELLGGRWGGRFGDDPATQKIEGWDAGHMEYKDP